MHQLLLKLTCVFDLVFTEFKECYNSKLILFTGSKNVIKKYKLIILQNLKNVISARSFVGWYNGLPEDKEVSYECYNNNMLFKFV